MSDTPRILGLDDGRIATENLDPGHQIGEEFLIRAHGTEFRAWDPTRSKLAAFLMKGGRTWPIREDSRVLYLGAANGTTVSHVSDIAHKGLVVAVEFSPRSFRDLLRVATRRGNIAPVLADAWQPVLYSRLATEVGVMVQDIAQRQQGLIFAKNLLRFKPKTGLLAVKARSVDVVANPRDVYEEVRHIVERETGGMYSCVESVALDPFEKDHAVLAFTKGKGAPTPTHAPQRQQHAPPPPPPRDAPRPRPAGSPPSFARRPQRRDDRR